MACSSSTILIFSGILETRDSVEDKVVDLALEFVQKQPNLLPNTELQAETYHMDFSASGLRTIQAGKQFIFDILIILIII